MAEMKQVLVPDIGNYKDVPVIEIMVKVGEVVKAEQSLLTLETDKATMDVPAPFDGVVKEIKIKVGDNISEGSLIFVMETSGTAAVVQIPPSPPFSKGGTVSSPTTAAQAPVAQPLVPATSDVPHFEKGGLGDFCAGQYSRQSPRQPLRAQLRERARCRPDPS